MGNRPLPSQCIHPDGIVVTTQRLDIRHQKRVGVCTCRSLSRLSVLSSEEEVENFDVSSLQEEVLRNIEADSFWCMSKLLDGIQVN
ncbi:TBC1 domain family member 22B-like [Tachysurus ichikawai]